MSFERDVDRVVARTGKKISAAMNGMIVDLPDAAPQMAIELVVGRLY
jgi:hypothetical protein